MTALNVIGPVSRHERFVRASPELFKTAPHHGGFGHDRSAVGIKTIRVIEVSGEVIVVKHAQGAVPRLAGGQAEAASRFLQPPEHIVYARKDAGLENAAVVIILAFHGHALHGEGPVAPEKPGEAFGNGGTYHEIELGARHVNMEMPQGILNGVEDPRGGVGERSVQIEKDKGENRTHYILPQRARRMMSSGVWQR